MRRLEPDICVIGAGSAGLTVAAAARSFGHTVVLIERARMGGDCLNHGCVPSKALIAAARHAHAVRDGARFGIHAEPRVDFAAVHRRVHAVIAAIAPHDSVERFEGLGVTVLKAHARFVDPRTVEADGVRVAARRFVIATGSRPLLPPIDGLAAIDPLTNESIFDLETLPRRLAVIGGGAIGAELGQAFARLGSAVTVVEADALLAREDRDAVAVVRAALAADGVDLVEGTGVAACERSGEATPGGGEATTRLSLADGRTLWADAVLVAAGRRPTTADLGLAAAGIAHDATGIRVDAGLRTTNRRVYAIGDVTGGPQFTHVAGHQASLAVRSIVFRLPVRFAPELMARTTYTAPELAQVGLTEAQAKARDPRAEAHLAPLAGNDRARTDGQTAGFVKLVADRRGRLVGATVVAPAAGEIVATYALALAAKVPLSTIASFAPPYPTLGEAGKRAAVERFATRLDRGWIRTVLAILKRF